MRPRSIAYVLCFGLIAGVGATDASPTIPTPSGPFGIGRVGYHWVDVSRPDQYSTGPDAHRELMVYFWYPATKSPDAKGQYFPGAQSLDAAPETQARMRREFGQDWPAIISGAIFSHAVERAPVPKSPRRFPVVIFSHGLGSSGFNYTCLIEDLVSRGYVVASIEHTYTAIAVWFPDGRVAPMHRDPPPPGLSREEIFKLTVAHIQDTITTGAADIRFVVNRLAEANRNSRFLLAGRLDLSRVAAIGHSAGAEFAARACQLDARLKACVDLDGGMPPVAALPEYPDGAIVKQPLLFLEPFRVESQVAGTAAEHAAYFKKKEAQLQALPAGSYGVMLRSRGIAHPSFSDIPLLFAGRDGYPETPVVLHNLDLIEQYIRDFLGKSLSQEKAHLLDGNSAATPEATIQRYGP